ncbi:Tetraspanin family [Novymonas esmeraldas]|uniref:Tetraspanin family n=1 Tax=Novymonas esmeraldas TaxID=1808958 RepID=A0AAW0ET85_9TRYP
MSILASARLLTEEGEPHAPTAGAAMEVEEAEDDDVHWVSDVYQQLNGAPRLNRTPRWQRLNKYRVAVGVFSAVFLLLGVAVVVWLSNCFAAALPSFGARCPSSLGLALGVGVLLVATGTLGCVGSCCACCKRVYLHACLSVLLALYALICGAAASYVTYERLHDLAGLHGTWAKVVATQPGVVCDVQARLQCSGFREGECCRGVALDSLIVSSDADGLEACYRVASNGSTFDLAGTAEVTWPKAMCAARCSVENAAFAPTCEAPLTSMLRSHFYSVVAVLLVFTLLFLLLGATSVASLVWRPRVDHRMRHRF